MVFGRDKKNTADLLEVFWIYKRWLKIRFDSMFKLNTGAATRGHTGIMLNYSGEYCEYGEYCDTGDA